MNKLVIKNIIDKIKNLSQNFVLRILQDAPENK